MGISRGELLRGRAGAVASPAPSRPPWASADFDRRCDSCDRCVSACPERILRADRDGRPVVDFASGGCSFCGACAAACPTGALSRGEGAAPWTLTARIGASCLSFGGVDCRMCGDHCETRAIRFRPLGRGRWLPDVVAADCIGCGACVGVCPVRAVTILSTAPTHRVRDHQPDHQKEFASCG